MADDRLEPAFRAHRPRQGGGGPVPICVRPAAVSDRQKAVSTLARAFRDDPLLRYIYPDETVRERRIGRFFDLLWLGNFPVGASEVSEGCEAVAFWRPPGRWRQPRRTMLTHSLAMLRTYGGAAGRVARCLCAMEAHHPARPHWYLMAVGTDPHHQGRGYAGALIGSRLTRCDAEGVPAYLEASTEGNIPFYAALGFRLTGEVTVPGGPIVYPMWRDPA